jgi:hypothetical protein
MLRCSQFGLARGVLAEGRRHTARKQVKQWFRKTKIRLIAQRDSDWRDLGLIWRFLPWVLDSATPQRNDRRVSAECH